MKRIIPVGIVFSVLIFSSSVNATLIVLDFESPLPGGLTPIDFHLGTPVPTSARITDQYSPLGVLGDNVALVELGSTHTASGVNGISSISPSSTVDYVTPMTFSFVSPSDSLVSAVTDYFSVTTDKSWSRTGTSTVFLKALALDGSVLGTLNYIEDQGAKLLELKDIGLFHSVVIDLHHEGTVGGIALDLVSFNEVQVVPEPTTLALLTLGIAGIGFSRKRMN